MRGESDIRGALAALLLLLTVPGTASVAAGGAAAAPAPRGAFVLSSPDRQLAGHFPDRYVLGSYGCTGGNVSPPLRWRGAPAGTKSYVLTLFDRDEHGSPSGWWHWLIYDIPAAIAALPAGAGADRGDALPRGARMGRTDLGTDAYHGPCPAAADAPHRYVFTLYALDVATLDVPADSSGAMITTSLQEHLLGRAVLTVRHGR